MKLKSLSAFAVMFAVLLSSSLASAAEALKVVENENVCMVTDMHFGKKQIPVTYQGQTYYGCCENCKETLSKDAKTRSAVDPVSGKSVDKAKAVIAMRSDNSVLYFESKKTFEQYSEKQKSPAKAHDHSHH